MDIKHIDLDSFEFKPDLGAQASFSSITQSTKFDNNYSQLFSMGINSLTMNLNLSFTELTDLDSTQLISFLQKSFFAEPQNYDTATGSFSNKRIVPFRYAPFYPYKPNNFYCFQFSHQKEHYNVNTITASFISASNSILDNVEMGANFNQNIQTRLNIDPLNPLTTTQYLISKEAVGVNATVNMGSNTYFMSDSYKYLTFESATNQTLTQDDTALVTFDQESNAYEPPITSTIYTAQNLRHSIFLDNPSECIYYPYPPMLVDGSTLDYRMFDFRASSIFNIQHSPKYRNSDAGSIYKKFNKYGFNPNLSNLSLVFDGRSDLEAKRILFFLESHLGHKKFAFHLSKDYSSPTIDAVNKSPHRRNYQMFYCPEWSHTFNYANNHTISATFIESLDY